uniref:Myb/SANT-like DNA-binding domain-containing protein n=1 Tax=Oryza glumipatula TaxID=40148 RepID=A0A0E0ATK3_9ORYZ
MGPRGVVGSAAMLGLEMHLAHPQMHATAYQQPDPHGGGGGGFQQQVAAVRQQQQQSYSPYSAGASSRVIKAPGHDDGMGNGAGKGGVVQQQQQPGSAGCPWTRMKWTDGMVRLLINVVYSVGDDGDGVAAGGAAGGKASAGAAGHGKAGGSGSHGAHGQAAAQQKKGKWKSVSRAMMESGHMVSPQQCEDKFNDLNKRYKRVVDLLGRGKACKVVENHALLDAMDELTHKAKDEARKLLSSKHLFFREMCAYHNSGAAAAAAAHGPHGAGAAGRRRGDDVSSAGAGDDDDEDGVKRARGAASAAGGGDDEGPSAVQQLQSELAAAVAGGGDPQQVRQWVRRRTVEVEEQQVAHEVRAYHLERQRLKWERFRANKERDMERARLRNDRLRIDGRRMLLLLRQKDLDFDIAEANSSSVDHLTSSAPPPLAALQQQQQPLGSSPSTAAGHPN